MYVEVDGFFVDLSAAVGGGSSFSKGCFMKLVYFYSLRLYFVLLALEVTTSNLECLKYFSDPAR